MQYLSSFAPITKPSQPTTVFLSDDDDLPQISEDTMEEIFRSARTTLGGGFQLNPVRGQTEEKYYFTQMRNSFTSRSAVPVEQNTVIAAALRTSEDFASLASDGQSTEWSVFDYAVSEAIYTYPLKRNFVINPGIGHAKMRMPTFSINRRSSSQWAGYYMDSYSGEYGKAPAKVNSYLDVTYSGGYSVTPEYNIMNTIPLLDCMYATRYQSTSSGTACEWGNSKVTDSFHSTELLFEPETVNIHFGLFPLSSTTFWKFERDIDFTVEDNLIPGSRPFIDFVTTHTEL
ncbi:hypothetical protein MPK71_gp193 [Erwinia phage pEa_SNUABM_1]|uniref:Uncharacterized protein n=1 Tax=Erwinia phage pEa_SNUABM_1 TaxID=2869543 RepID=A0AAE8BZT8_9CAUD|nr:hypothetical protein MPK71_gp193 [Erwinia phage pEa_SNUABM_1]QZE57402.1 hypothetical protein pEaSNUABM1_00193 [Erwinia phage pEa_SNUABM_1]